MGYYAGPKPIHICSHVSRLKGCTRLKGHTAQGKDHWNMFSKGPTWKDEDGQYIETKQDWDNMINQLGKPKQQ